MENGFLLYPLNGEPRRTEPDNCGEATLTWLESEFRVSRVVLQDMSLRKYSEQLTECRSTGAMAWLVPLRYTHARYPYGPSFCAKCLGSAPRPGFQLRWRLAFVTDCEKHGVRLQDRCPRCGRSVWPHAATQAHLFSQVGHGLNECAYCGFDLSRSPTVDSDPSVSTELHAHLASSDPVSVGTNSVSAAAFFDGLRLFSHLFLRRRTATKIKSGDAEWGEACVDVDTRSQRQIEFLGIDDRRRVVSAAMKLVQHWPNDFVSFCRAFGVTQYHITDSGTPVPAWVEAIASKHLAKRTTGVDAKAVHASIAALRATGAIVTKAAVARSIGCSQAKAIDDVLSRRVNATESEVAEFIDRLAAMPMGPSRRRSTRYVRARNVAIVGASIVCRFSLEAGSTMSLEALIAACAGVRDLTEQGLRLRTEAVASARLAVGLAQDLWEPCASGRMQGPAGGDSAGEAAQRLLGACMAGLDTRLWRHPSVFATCTHLPGAGQRRE